MKFKSTVESSEYSTQPKSTVQNIEYSAEYRPVCAGFSRVRDHVSLLCVKEA